MSYSTENVRAWDNDARNDSAAFRADTERAEHHAALRGDYDPCTDGRHDYTPNRSGGGTCRHCGDTITTDEINATNDEAETESDDDR